MNQLFESAFGQSGMAAAGGWAPAVDVEETEDAHVVEAELRGVQRDDVQVEGKHRGSMVDWSRRS